MSIFEWFYQLSHFRSIIRELKRQLLGTATLNIEYRERIEPLEQAIRIRDYALEYLSEPLVSPDEENKPLRTFRPRQSYAEQQRGYEIGNHKNVRDHLQALEQIRQRRPAK